MNVYSDSGLTALCFPVKQDSDIYKYYKS